MSVTMVTRCCPCGVGGSKKGRHRKSAPEDRKHLISAEGSKKGRKRPVSGDSAVSNSTFASASVSAPHNYEDECDARLEGQDQHDEDRRVRAKAA